MPSTTFPPLRPGGTSRQERVLEGEPVMGGEDFSFYGQEVPACFFWLGLLNEGQDRYPNLHAPEFDFNDKALPFGIRAMCELALSEAALGSARESSEAMALA